MYFSLLPKPGYDLKCLLKYGIEGEYHFFYGTIIYGNDSILLSWNSPNASIEGNPTLNVLTSPRPGARSVSGLGLRTKLSGFFSPRLKC